MQLICLYIIIDRSPQERCKSRLSSTNKICERCFLCRSIVFCKMCHKCPNCCSKSTCWDQIAPVLGKMGSPRRQPQSSNNLPFRFRPNLTTSPNIISCCVNPHRNLYLLEALHQLMTKNAVEPVTNQTSLGFFNQLFLVPNPNNRWRPILDLSNLNKYLKTRSFKIETPETIRTSLQTGEWVTSIDFKDAYFHIPIQSQSKKYMHFHKQDKAYHFKALSFGLSTAHGVHCSGQRGQVSCTAKGYKNPPVPRQLVGHSQIPPNWSPTYKDTNIPLSGIRLASEQREIRTGTKTSIRFCRLPVRPEGGQGQTHVGTLADLEDKNKRPSDRSVCPVRKLMSSIGLLTATEKQVHLGRLHMRPIQWHLKNNWRVRE